MQLPDKELYAVVRIESAFEEYWSHMMIPYYNINTIKKSGKVFICIAHCFKPQ